MALVLVWIAAAILLITLIVAYICYHITFYMPPSKHTNLEMPDAEIYGAYQKAIEKWVAELRAMPHKEFTVTSFDGLQLYGKFYEYKPGAPIELMLHGYRGSAERDLSGGVQRAFSVGRSVLLVDQRCCGKSEGRTITFGIKEHKDCLTWVDFLCKEFGEDVKIILTGISMGAATVVMAGGNPLPKNVIGILADCGYSSPKAIICKVIRQIGLPIWLCYPFVRLGAWLFGHFDLEADSPANLIRQCKIPIIFYHGEKDNFVPCQMSRELYDACPSKKKLVTIPDAGHGLSYPVAPERYLETLREFFGEEASWQE